MENIDKMINCGDPSFGGAMYGCPHCGKLKFVDILTANIVSVKNVDSRLPDVKGQEYVIKCVTVHKSKGLEYGSVILPYCSAAINIMKRSDINVSVVNESGISEIWQSCWLMITGKARIRLRIENALL